jgi:glycosyltransferase involved in cell wall biosynthesis
VDRRCTLRSVSWTKQARSFAVLSKRRIWLCGLPIPCERSVTTEPSSTKIPTPMKLVIAHSQLNSYGGGERSTLELLRHLGRRHEVELWTSRYQPGATYAELAEFPRRTLHSYQWLTGIRSDADAVVAQSFGSYLLALRHPHTICYLHTLRSRYLVEASSSGTGGGGSMRLDLELRRRLDRVAIGRAARLLTNSAYSAGKILERYGKSAAIVPPGVGEEYFASAPSGAAPGSYALYVGRLAPEKGIERLLEWSRGVPLELVVAGGGPSGFLAHLRAMAGPHATFTGPVSGSALIDLYAGCRYLAFLPDAEEFGLAALEAMAAGKPVLASRQGALPELVRDGQTGFLVESAEEYRAAASRLSADDNLCRLLGERGRRAARSYSWDTFAGTIEQACVQVAARA